MHERNEQEDRESEKPMSAQLSKESSSMIHVSLSLQLFCDQNVSQPTDSRMIAVFASFAPVGSAFLKRGGLLYSVRLLIAEWTESVCGLGMPNRIDGWRATRVCDARRYCGCGRRRRRRRPSVYSPAQSAQPRLVPPFRNSENL